MPWLRRPVASGRLPHLALLAGLALCSALSGGETAGGDPFAWRKPAQAPEPRQAADDAATDRRWSWHLDHAPRWRVAADATVVAMVVSAITPNGAADRAGLVEGDLVVSIDGGLPPHGMLPAAAKPRLLVVRGAEGGERRCTIPAVEPGCWLVTQCCYEVGWRAQRQRKQAADEPMLVAAMALQHRQADVAASALVRARAAGADGPYFRALQALVATALGRTDEALAASELALAGLPVAERRAVLLAQRDAAVIGMKLPLYEDWLKQHATLAAANPTYHRPATAWDDAEVRDGAAWLLQPLEAAATLPSRDRTAELTATDRKTWATKLIETGANDWQAYEGGKFTTTAFEPAVQDFCLTFDLQVQAQTRRHTNWGRNVRLTCYGPGDTGPRAMPQLQWMVDLTHGVTQSIVVIGNPYLAPQLPFHADGTPNRIELAAYRGMVQMRVNGYDALLAPRRRAHQVPWRFRLYAEGLLWHISGFTFRAIGEAPAAKPASDF